MKIAVINVAASSGGALSVLKEFYSYIRNNRQNNNGQDLEWLFLVTTPQLEEDEHIKVINFPWIKESWFHRAFWDFYVAPRIIQDYDADIVFSMQNVCIPRIKIPQVLYVHQPLPFQNVKKFSFFKRQERLLAVYQYINGFHIKKSAKKADTVIVQTQWMKAAMEKTGIGSNKILVIPPTIDKSIIDKKLETFPYLDGEPISSRDFFYPASIALYKNHECLIKAVLKLLDQGYEDFKVILTLPQEAKKEILGEKVLVNRVEKGDVIISYKRVEKLADVIIFAGQVSRGEVLRRCHESILVFPSYIETFGMPLLEAKMVKGVILASDCSFSHEILEGYENVRYFDPFNAEELALLMRKLLDREIVYRYQSNHTKNENSESSKDFNNWQKVVGALKQAGNSLNTKAGAKRSKNLSVR
jgi:glycosyltransferase involved in cell wall biosynthesis